MTAVPTVIAALAVHVTVATDKSTVVGEEDYSSPFLFGASDAKICTSTSHTTVPVIQL